jgi:hypothetical protein
MAILGWTESSPSLQAALPSKQHGRPRPRRYGAFPVSKTRGPKPTSTLPVARVPVVQRPVVTRARARARARAYAHAHAHAHAHARAHLPHQQYELSPLCLWQHYCVNTRFILYPKLCDMAPCTRVPSLSTPRLLRLMAVLLVLVLLRFLPATPFPLGRSFDICFAVFCSRNTTILIDTVSHRDSRLDESC